MTGLYRSVDLPKGRDELQTRANNTPFLWCFWEYFAPAGSDASEYTVKKTLVLKSYLFTTKNSIVWQIKVKAGDNLV